ncbi:MAG: STAS domain-containing protein [Bryobacteraceae bacterium]|nr:STAS domain-containing protein [Bryobacteraceae bacterium]
MNLTTETIGNVVVVTLPGETLDAGNTKPLKDELTAVLQPGAKLVFDLSQLRFVDSSGLGLLLSSLRQVHNTGGDLKLCGMNKAVRALFELVRMHRVFEIFATRDEARASYGS